tara:strand:- start:13234 stop:14529 length:1296 start_codon:yes stop_codon:yes gene_type:complete
MIATALLAAVIVALASYWLGARWATDELESRFRGIKSALSDSSFPLNAMVLDSLAELTQTELIGIDDTGNITHGTVSISASALSQSGDFISSDSHRYRVHRFVMEKQSRRPDRVVSIAVLFDQQTINATRQRAALLPLLTGLSTILAITTISLVVTSRLSRRIGKLRQGVESVAQGDFQRSVSDDVRDEIGLLGGAVDRMAMQLDQLWKGINRQQSEKVIHQIAGGMAHQLRNSLTGARMAVELHADQCPTADDEGIRVAIDQIEIAEDYVRRLLLVASGRQDQDRPSNLQTCFDDVRKSISPVAKHRKIDISWQCDDGIGDRQVTDGPTWVAAVSNLIHNAMQEGEHVEVSLTQAAPDLVRVSVSDDGPGVPDAIADELFEPFVTSKPEGMGLGLAVVRRAAERLGGQISWHRDPSRTVFEFDALTRETS